jgi:chromosome segregation ATPase
MVMAENNRLKKDLEGFANQINNSESDIKSMVVELDNKDQVIKQQKQRLLSIKEECQRKVFSLLNFRKKFLQKLKKHYKYLMNLLKKLDNKLRETKVLYNGKESQIDNLKTRIELLQTYAITHQNQEEEINLLHKQLKTSKLETLRKLKVNKQLKFKIIQLEKEVDTTKKEDITRSIGISKNSFIILQTHLKNTKEKIKEMEAHLNRYNSRELQFISAIEKMLTHILTKNQDFNNYSSKDSNISQIKIEEMAQKISKQVSLK